MFFIIVMSTHRYNKIEYYKILNNVAFSISNNVIAILSKMTCIHNNCTSIRNYMNYDDKLYRKV